MNSFRDLEAWRETKNLAVIVYKITEHFPKSEVFGLTNQLRRAVVSISSNIAEGFCRKTNKDKTQFYSIALGSLSELESQLSISKEVGYLSNDELMSVMEKVVLVGKLTGGLKRSINL
ncbi:hypothetical protein A2108_00725 [Candidatus Wolfebacteria bacterium GWA1_42_9]|uniref:Four helix bundle protein n=1 Tax=Candidatus Wolfebacteria bacterium GWA1_42_9 TaxID=1802553 RepID=A0A1F8DND9_9BACT|nr:MAG: hypothetical protein A2108_00725 [Candidatus Wolfebacteria bacterium GWA1_42_9]